MNNGQHFEPLIDEFEETPPSPLSSSYPDSRNLMDDSEEEIEDDFRSMDLSQERISSRHTFHSSHIQGKIMEGKKYLEKQIIAMMTPHYLPYYKLYRLVGAKCRRELDQLIEPLPQSMKLEKIRSLYDMIRRTFPNVFEEFQLPYKPPPPLRREIVRKEEVVEREMRKSIPRNRRNVIRGGGEGEGEPLQAQIMSQMRNLTFSHRNHPLLGRVHMALDRTLQGVESISSSIRGEPVTTEHYVGMNLWDIFNKHLEEDTKHNIASHHIELHGEIPLTPLLSGHLDGLIIQLRKMTGRDIHLHTLILNDELTNTFAEQVGMRIREEDYEYARIRGDRNYRTQKMANDLKKKIQSHLLILVRDVRKNYGKTTRLSGGVPPPFYRGRRNPYVPHSEVPSNNYATHAQLEEF